MDRKIWSSLPNQFAPGIIFGGNFNRNTGNVGLGCTLWNNVSFITSPPNWGDRHFNTEPDPAGPPVVRGLSKRQKTLCPDWKLSIFTGKLKITTETRHYICFLLYTTVANYTILYYQHCASLLSSTFGRSFILKFRPFSSPTKTVFRSKIIYYSYVS